MTPRPFHDPHASPRSSGAWSVGGRTASSHTRLDDMPAPQRHQAGRRDCRDAYANSLSGEDPFANPIDQEETAVEPSVPAVVGPPPSLIPDGSNQLSLHHAGAGVLHESLLQCPFCQSVFRSTVAGRLTLCPVCAAVAEQNAKSPAGHLALPEPPRWQRSGKEVPANLRRKDACRAPHEVPYFRRKYGAHARAATAARSRHGSLILVAGLGIFGVLVAGLARQFHADVQQSAPTRQDHAEVRESTSMRDDAVPPGDNFPAQSAASPITLSPSSNTP